MNLELEFYGAYCATGQFNINGIKANSADFGEQYDRDPYDEAEEFSDEAYSCGNMQFTRLPARSEVLAKYSITAPEYELVAGQLEVGLSFGSCGWCV